MQPKHVITVGDSCTHLCRIIHNSLFISGKLRTEETHYVAKPPERSQKATYSTVFLKNSRQFSGARVHGNSTILHGPESDIRLHIPAGLYGFVFGHGHTNPLPFLNHIPESETLVGPIAEFNSTITDLEKEDQWFKVEIPHCIRKQRYLKSIKVRHGDIYKDIPFTESPSDNCYFEVNERFVIIYTRHFSQFICSCCGNPCEGEAKGFVFGSISPLQCTPITAALTVYICSPLYNILDYKMVRQRNICQC